ncbi:hypothetical protein Hanom_Chr05g00402951 [Helianthus anomalus]
MHKHKKTIHLKQEGLIHVMFYPSKRSNIFKFIQSLHQAKPAHCYLRFDLHNMF